MFLTACILQHEILEFFREFLHALVKCKINLEFTVRFSNAQVKVQNFILEFTVRFSNSKQSYFPVYTGGTTKIQVQHLIL